MTTGEFSDTGRCCKKLYKFLQLCMLSPFRIRRCDTRRRSEASTDKRDKADKSSTMRSV